MKLRPASGKWAVLQSPYVRYGAFALALGLWSYGLVEQLHGFATTAIYLLLTLLIAAIATI